MLTASRRRARPVVPRAGATLVELLVALVITGVVVAAVARSRDASRGAGTDALARTEARRQLRAGTGAVGATLRGLAPAADLRALADSVVELRVTLGATVLCGATPTTVEGPASLTVLQPRAAAGAAGVPAAWHDAPAPGDELLVLVDEPEPATAPSPADTGAAADRTRWRWHPLRVAAAGTPVRAPCLGAAEAAAERVPLAEEPPATVADGAEAGAPVLVTRRGRWSVYASGGRHFLGWRDVAASGVGFDVVQPVSGPHDVRDAARGAWRAGASFAFADAAGAPTAEAARVAAIAARLAASPAGAGRVDSLEVLVAPRNGAPAP